MPENGAIQSTVFGRGCGISCAGVHIPCVFIVPNSFPVQIPCVFIVPNSFLFKFPVFS